MNNGKKYGFERMEGEEIEWGIETRYRKRKNKIWNKSKKEKVEGKIE